MFEACWIRLKQSRKARLRNLMHLRENGAECGSTQRRQERQRFSGTDSFRDFSGAEPGQFDYLVNTGKPGRIKTICCQFRIYLI
jgi:hypothetical protein